LARLVPKAASVAVRYWQPVCTSLDTKALLAVPLRTYFIGFVGRAIGAAIFGHYVPTYQAICIWGVVIVIPSPHGSGNRGRRGMRRFGASGGEEPCPQHTVRS
jgi:hypothetical protein